MALRTVLTRILAACPILFSHGVNAGDKPRVVTLQMDSAAPTQLVRAQPCLVSTKKCMDLSTEPFVLCRVATQDCPRTAELLLVDPRR